MTKIYACLIGEWVCLNDYPDSYISDYKMSPYLWWEENSPIYAPSVRDTKLEHSFYGLDYVIVYHQKKRYRISPTFIQIVEE